MSDKYTLIFELDIKDLEEKIQDFAKAKLTSLESDLLLDKYIEGNKQINLRQHAKNHSCSMKKTSQALERAEGKLYRHLQQFI